MAENTTTISPEDAAKAIEILKARGISLNDPVADAVKKIRELLDGMENKERRMVLKNINDAYTQKRGPRKAKEDDKEEVKTSTPSSKTPPAPSQKKS